MNTTNSNVIQDIVNKLPVTLFFDALPDRKQALKYVNWIYTNNPQSHTVSQDKLFREVISKELRLVSMKIIEIEILFMVALSNITIEDFTLDSESLIKKIISENPDKNDLDLMYRILAQIMSKLPMDLKDKVTGKHKLQIFQYISKFINMEPKLLERFMSFNPSLNTPISMELDAGDYNTLNKKYLNELYEFEKSQSYIDSNSMEYSTIAQNMLNIKPTLGNNIKGQYIDSSPDLMTGVNDNKLYYFDSSSGTINEFPVSDSNQVPVSLNDLSNILSANKVNKSQVSDLIKNLQVPTQPNSIPSPSSPSPLPTSTSSSILTASTTTMPMTIHPISYLDWVSTLFSYGSNNTTPTIPTTTTPIITSNNKYPTVPLVTIERLTAPIPPQYILEHSESLKKIQQQEQQQEIQQQEIQQQEIQQQKLQKQEERQQNQSNSNSQYNPNDFINPTNNIPVEFNIKPQQTSDFLTRNDSCSLPNPPSSCPVRTNPSVQINNNLDKLYEQRQSTYEPIEQFTSFGNMNSNNEADFIKKISKKNKDIENVAIAFVTIIVLLFLLVIFNSIRNKSGLANTK